MWNCLLLLGTKHLIILTVKTNDCLIVFQYFEEQTSKKFCWYFMQKRNHFTLGGKNTVELHCTITIRSLEKKQYLKELGLPGFVKSSGLAMYLKSSSAIFLWPEDVHVSLCLTVILLLYSIFFSPATLLLRSIRPIVCLPVLHSYSCLWTYGGGQLFTIKNKTHCN